MRGAGRFEKAEPLDFGPSYLGRSTSRAPRLVCHRPELHHIRSRRRRHTLLRLVGGDGGDVVSRRHRGSVAGTRPRVPQHWRVAGVKGEESRTSRPRVRGVGL